MTTRRELFEKVKSQLLASRERATFGVAQRIVDPSKYGAVFYGSSCDPIALNSALAEAGLDPQDIALLQSLTNVHDTVDPDRWPTAFAEFEKAHTA